MTEIMFLLIHGFDIYSNIQHSNKRNKNPHTHTHSNSSSTNTGYLSNQYPSSQTSSAYPSQANAYQNNQSVYGNSGLSNNAG